MHRASHYHGRIVISLSTGSMVGRVRRVVADLDQGRLGGLLVQPEGTGTTTPVAIPGSEVQSFGEDAIMVRHGPDEVSPEASAQVFDLMKREHQVFRTGLYTSGGTKVGYLVEPYYQLEGGHLKPVAYEVFSDLLFSDRVRGILLNGAHITLGRDLILIPDDVAGYLLAEEDDLAMQVRGELGNRPASPLPARGAGNPMRPPPPPPPAAGEAAARPASSPGGTAAGRGGGGLPRPAPPPMASTAAHSVRPSPPPAPEKEPERPPEISSTITPADTPAPEAARVPTPDAQDFDADSLSDVIAGLGAAGDRPPAAAVVEDEPEEDAEVSISSLPEKDQKVVKFVLGKRASRDLEADGAYIVRRGESITEDVVKLALKHDMLTLLFLAASDAG